MSMHQLPATIAAQHEATVAWHAAKRSHPLPLATIDNVWETFAARTRAADPAEHLAIATEAAAIMRAFAGLTPQGRTALVEAERAHSLDFPQDRAAALNAADAVWAAHPVLAAFHAQQVEARAAHDVEIAAAAERHRQQVEQEAPGLLLEALRARGLDIGLTDDGTQITLPSAQVATLLPGEAEAVKRHRAGIIAVLKAEAEAARPVVVA